MKVFWKIIVKKFLTLRWTWIKVRLKAHGMGYLTHVKSYHFDISSRFYGNPNSRWFFYSRTVYNTAELQCVFCCCCCSHDPGTVLSNGQLILILNGHILLSYSNIYLYLFTIWRKEMMYLSRANQLGQ